MTVSKSALVLLGYSIVTAMQAMHSGKITGPAQVSNNKYMYSYVCLPKEQWLCVRQAII